MSRKKNSWVRQTISRIAFPISRPFQPSQLTQVAVQRELKALRNEMRERTPRNPALAGYKIYSQADEDGVLREIFNRIGMVSKTFVEFGCGNGLENNTYALLMTGWRGVWVDGSNDNIDDVRQMIPLESRCLHVRQLFVTKENVGGVITDALKRFSADELDLLSMDLDGNDLHLLQEGLLTAKPRAIIAEYNPKFPPPMSFKIEYDPAHSWALDDYYGASLQTLSDGLVGYRLVGCNLVGGNAFFVREDLAEPFERYSLEQLYQPARLDLGIVSGHAASLKPLRDLIKREDFATDQ